MVHSLIKILCTIFLLVQMAHPLAQTVQLGQSIQLAQLDSSTAAIDLDPPQVDHIPVASGVAGAPQSLSVKASDLQGIASVTLLYRYNPENEYKRILMREVTGTDNYTVALETSKDQRLIEYYFLAIDTGGNKVLNGFPYEPFLRTLTAPQVPLAHASNTETVPANDSLSPSATTPAAEESTGKTNSMLWVALGVVAVGILAAASGGSDGGTAQTQETVPVVLNIPLPN